MTLEFSGSNTARIAIVGDFNAAFAPHAATSAALERAAKMLRLSVAVEWLPTESITSSPASQLASFAAFWIAPGSPYQSLDGALADRRPRRLTPNAAPIPDAALARGRRFFVLQPPIGGCCAATKPAQFA